jgi:hypothetical protein
MGDKLLLTQFPDTPEGVDACVDHVVATASTLLDSA